jgi:hypothetical protein
MLSGRLDAESLDSGVVQARDDEPALESYTQVAHIFAALLCADHGILNKVYL